MMIYPHKKLLPVVKQLANDSMINNAINVKEACGNDRGECGISLDGSCNCHLVADKEVLRCGNSFCQMQSLLKMEKERK